MREVVLQIPTLESEQNIEIDVQINGRKKKMKYRVEIVDFENGKNDPDDKVAVLKHFIEEHEKGWELIQIGAPIKEQIPIMFRKKSEE